MRTAALLVLLPLISVPGGTRAADLLVGPRELEALGSIRGSAVALEKKSQEGRAEELDALLKELSSEKWSKRALATSKIGTMGPKARRAIPAVILLLKDEHPSVRKLAAGVLPKLGAPSYDEAEALLGLLEDKDERVFKAAEAAVLSFGEDGTVIVEGMREKLKEERARREEEKKRAEEEEIRRQREADEERRRIEEERRRRLEEEAERDRKMWLCSGMCTYERASGGSGGQILTASARGRTDSAARSLLSSECATFMSYSSDIYNRRLDGSTVTCR